MIHISKLANERVEKVEDVVNIGDVLECRVAEIDSQGRINLVRNDIVYDNEAMPVRRPCGRKAAGGGSLAPQGLICAGKAPRKELCLVFSPACQRFAVSSGRNQAFSANEK